MMPYGGALALHGKVHINTVVCGRRRSRSASARATTLVFERSALGGTSADGMGGGGEQTATRWTAAAPRLRELHERHEVLHGVLVPPPPPRRTPRPRGAPFCGRIARAAGLLRRRAPPARTAVVAAPRRRRRRAASASASSATSSAARRSVTAGSRSWRVSAGRHVDGRRRRSSAVSDAAALDAARTARGNGARRMRAETCEDDGRSVDPMMLDISLRVTTRSRIGARDSRTRNTGGSPRVPDGERASLRGERDIGGARFT